MRAQIDFHSFFGPGLNRVSAVDGNGLQSRLFVRRLLLELGGEFMKRWTFYGSVELSQTVANPNGRNEISAAAANQQPNADTARFQSAQTVGVVAAPDDVWVAFSVAPWLNFQLGHYLAPFSMENRTSNKFISFMERHMPIRSFALPSADELGFLVWGEIEGKKINYEVGVFAGEGANRPQLDDKVDFIGRVFARPLLDCNCAVSGAQIGVSGRVAARDPAFIEYDYPAITSAQGYRLWNPQYTDERGRLIHILSRMARVASSAFRPPGLLWVASLSRRGGARAPS